MRTLRAVPTYAVVLVIVLYATDLLLLPTQSAWALLLQLVIPAVSWTVALSCRRQMPGIKAGLTGLGLVYVATCVAVLLVHYLPGSIPQWTISLTGMSLVGVSLVVLQKDKHHSHVWTSICSYLSILVLLSAVLRLWGASSNEFAGDEALILSQTSEAIAGRDDIVFWHKKGPVELLIPIVTWLSNGTIDESTARFPFALLSVAAVLAGYELSRTWSSKGSALLSAAFIAVNGYFVAYGRIVQYQSVILMMLPLAFLYLQDDSRWGAFLAGLFFGFALLAHYDAVIALPAFGYGLVATGRRAWRSPIPWRRVLQAACGLLIVTLPFYGPFLLSPGFKYALSYLVEARMSGEGPLFESNYAEFLSVDAVYNSSYYLVSLGVMLLIAILRDLSHWGRILYHGALLLLVPASIAAALWGSRWVLGSVNWSFLPIMLLLGLCVAAPRLPLYRRMLWLWFATSYLFYLFVVADPRTHIYNVYLPWIFLATDALQWAWRGSVCSWPRPARHTALTMGVALYIAMAGFPYLAFVRQDQDYVASYPDSRASIYWAFSDDVPENVYFGFSHNVGWRTVAEVLPEEATAVLYNSNEIPRVTEWYLPQGLRTQCDYPDFYIIDLLHPDHVFDTVPIDEDILGRDYGLIGIVTVADQPSLEVYQHGKQGQVVEMYSAEAFDSEPDDLATPDRWLRQLPEDNMVPMDVSFGNSITLESYSLGAHSAKAGDTLPLVLYWDTSQLVEDNYVVFVHLIEDGVVQRGSGDSLPDCGAQPTPLWVPGELVIDYHDVQVFEDVECTQCGLFVGMYDLYSGQRVPAYAGGERIEGDTLYLTSVEIVVE